MADRNAPTLTARDVEHFFDIVERTAQRTHSKTGRPLGECYRTALDKARQCARQTAYRKAGAR